MVSQTLSKMSVSPTSPAASPMTESGSS